MSCTSPLITADLPPPSARFVPRSCRGDGWDALADIEVFAFTVEAELEAMDRERVGVQGDLLGDSGFKGVPFAAAALVHDIHVSVSPGGTQDGRFLPCGIRWVVERLFAWLSRYRRLNICTTASLISSRGPSGLR